MADQNKIRPQYIKAIRTAASKLWNDEDYHTWLADNFDGIKSTKELTHQESKEALKLLSNLTGYKPNRKQYSGAGGRNLSQDQAYKIGALQKLLNWTSLQKFILRQTGKLKAVEFLTHKEASKVIIGMQRILSKGDAQIYNYLNNYKQTDSPESSAGKALLKLVEKGISVHANG